MELVYLWVDTDTTIQENEFNFGSEYRFSFTTDEYLEIEKQNEYVKDLYSYNIKISAVVGSNGVGKSQLLKLIWNGITHESYFAIVLINDEFRLIGAKVDEQSTLSINGKTKISEVEFNGKKFDLNIDNERYSSFPIDNLTTYLSTNENVCEEIIQNNIQISSNQKFSSMECLIEQKISASSQKVFKIVKNIRNIIVHPNGDHTDTDSKILDLYNEFELEYLSYTKLKLQIESDMFEKVLAIVFDDKIKWYKDMKKPESVQVILDTNIWDKFILENESLLPKFDKESLYDKVFMYYATSWILDFQKHSNAPDEIRKKYKEIGGKYFDNLDMNVNIDSYLSDMSKEYTYTNEKKATLIHFSLAKKYFLALKKLLDVLSNLSNFIIDGEILITITDNNKNIISEFADAHLSVLLESLNIKPLLTFNILPIMSSGHKYTLNTFAILYDNLNRIEDENIILLLDEIEVFLHPNWQKNFVRLLLNFLDVRFENKKIHIIFATHSPFILSDIPKSNIVFLGKEARLSQTFGANIHTLLSDGFFMDEGLMGSYAKEKIEEVVAFLNYNGKGHMPKIKTYKEAKEIVEIVGEPLLKMKLEKMLNSYMAKNKIKSAVDIQKKIDKLTKELEEIKNG